MWPRLCMLIFAAALAESNACGQTPVASIEIDLQEQTAYLIQNGRAILATPISSAREGHLTKTGSFKVLERARSHFSTLHGKIVDARQHDRRRCGRGHARAARLQIRAGADALFHSF